MGDCGGYSCDSLVKCNNNGRVELKDMSHRAMTTDESECVIRCKCVLGSNASTPKAPKGSKKTGSKS